VGFLSHGRIAGRRGAGLAALGLMGVAAVAGALGARAMFQLKPAVPAAAMTAATRAETAALQERLIAHVRTLGAEIGERNVFRPAGLEAAAGYIRDVWAAQGLSVRAEPYEVRGIRCANLVVEVAGSSRGHELVLVGAHYDSVRGSPGANDNATGVAVLLELSRALRSVAPARSLRLVAFVNEEPPFFQTAAMGSRRHALEARRRGETIVAMLSLETLGAYSEAPGSQTYPFPLSAFYPRTGNFLGVVGNLRSRALVREIVTHFMAVTDFPVEAAATFAWIPGVDWSDHWAFWKAGYAAVMLTDTALYRYAEYHSAADRPEVVNAREFARAAHGIIETVRRLVTAP
jgi:Peptidase family M28